MKVGYCMKEKEIEYNYDIPEGFIEIDPSHYEEVGLKGLVKQSTLHFFVKVVNGEPVASISVNRDSFLDEENTYDSILNLNVANLKASGFETSNITDGKRKDGVRYTKCVVNSKKMKIISMFTIIGSLFVGSSTLATPDGASEKALEKFINSITIK